MIRTSICNGRSARVQLPRRDDGVFLMETVSSHSTYPRDASWNFGPWSAVCLLFFSPPPHPPFPFPASPFLIHVAAPDCSDSTCSLSKTIRQGKVEGGRRRRERRGKFSMDNVKEWTSLPRTAHDGFPQRRLEERISAEWSLMPPIPLPPNDPFSQGTELKWTFELEAS